MIFRVQITSHRNAETLETITSTRTALIRDLFSYGFPRKLPAGPYGSYDKSLYMNLLFRKYVVTWAKTALSLVKDYNLVQECR